MLQELCQQRIIETMNSPSAPTPVVSLIQNENTVHYYIERTAQVGSVCDAVVMEKLNQLSRHLPQPVLDSLYKYYHQNCQANFLQDLHQKLASILNDDSFTSEIVRTDGNRMYLHYMNNTAVWKPAVFRSNWKEINCGKIRRSQWYFLIPCVVCNICEYYAKGV